jgi:hypothetical protein
MGSIKPDRRYNVISMRITDEERITLNLLTKAKKKSVSEIMREAMTQLGTDFDSLGRNSA